MTSSEYASWVQAIGSILAILAAGGIAFWQQRNIERARLADSKRQRRVDDDIARDLAIKVIDWFRNLRWNCQNLLRTWADGVPATARLGEDWAPSPLDEFEVPIVIRECSDRLHQLQDAAKDAQQAFFYARDVEDIVKMIVADLQAGEDVGGMDMSVRPLLVKALASSTRAVEQLEKLIMA